MISPGDSIGVILTSHNQDIRRPLGSLWKQKVPLRILIIDDGSDPPIEKPTGSSAVDLVRLPFNQGVQAARNLGWAALRDLCPYMLFSDGDIIWKDGALPEMLKLLKKSPPEVGYIYGMYERTGKLGGVYPSAHFDPDLLREYNYISTMSLVRTAVLPEPPFIPDEERLQDWSLWLRLLKNGIEGRFLKKVIFEAEFGPLSVSLAGMKDYEKWHRIIQTRYAK